MRSSRRVAAILVALGLGAWSPAPAGPPGAPQEQRQGDTPRFRGGVELVQLDVSVLDGKRRPVLGLTASDFTILENGEQRPVRAFDAVHLPPGGPAAEAVLTAAVPLDVATNQVGQQDGRLVVILMDRSIPAGQPTIAARRIATEAVEALGPGDLAAVVSTSGGVPQNLTADRTRLIHAIERRDWSTGITREQEEIMGKLDPLSDGRCLCGLCVLETMTRVSDALRDAPRRRKMLLFIGSSVIFQAAPRDPSADVGCEFRLRDTRRELFDSLALSNLTVHSIDPNGLVSVGAHTRAGAGGGKGPGDAQVQRLLKLQAETNDLLVDQGSLRVLPDLTGGRTVLNTNAPEASVPEIFRESEAYYVLAFEPGTPARGEDKRSIEVKVARRGVHVHAQRQYLRPPLKAASAAVSTGANASLEKALRGLLPDGSKPLTLSVAAFAGPDRGKAVVVVNADAGAFANAAATPMPLEFAVSAIDPTGRQLAYGHQAATVTFRPGTSNRAEANVQTQLELMPGDYEVRVAVADPATGVAASIFRPVTVPPFGSAPLSLSDVIVETAGRTATLAQTTRRVFGRNEEIRAIVQVYQGTERADAIVPVSVRTSIADATGRVVRDQRLALPAAEFTNRRASLALDIGRLPAGEYVLTVDAAAERGKANRFLRFAVR